MSDFHPFGIYGVLEKYGQPYRRAQAFLYRWIAFLRESTLAGCHWELKDTRFWPKWLLASIPFCLFATTICVMGYGWQSVVMTKWHATSTYHRQLALSAYSQRLRPTRHNEWISRRMVIHRQWLTLLDKLSAPVSPMESLTERSQESGLVVRHLMPLEKDGRQSYSLLLEGTFNGIMKFLLDPVGKSIWTIEAMTIEVAAAEGSLGSMNQTKTNGANSMNSLGAYQTSLHGTHADEVTTVPAVDSPLLSLMVVVSWIEPRILASVFSSKQSDIQYSGHSTHTDLLDKGTALLDQLTYEGFDKPRLNPFEPRRGRLVDQSPDISSVSTRAQASSNTETTSRDHAPVKTHKGSPELIFLGIFSDQWGRKALVKVRGSAPCIVGEGELIPMIKLKVIALDKHVLTVENPDGTHVVRVLRHGLREPVNHE